MKLSDVPMKYKAIFCVCFAIGFMAQSLEPLKPVYHWKEML